MLDGTGDLLLLRRPAAVSLGQAWSPTGEVVGQVASQRVTVEARAGGPLGPLLAALVAVPGSTLEASEWLVDPGNAAHSRLRAAAVQDARDRAVDYARAAELRLGALEWIAEPDAGRSDPVPVGMRFAAQEKSSGPGGPVLELVPEPVAVSVAVDVRYALLAGPAHPSHG